MKYRIFILLAAAVLLSWFVVVYISSDGDSKSKASAVPSSPSQPEELVKFFGSLLEKARHGDVKSLDSVGCCYENGIGIAKDGTEALAWYYLAVAAGDELAKPRLDALETVLPYEKIQAAHKRAIELKNLIDANVRAENLKTFIGASRPVN